MKTLMIISVGEESKPIYEGIKKYKGSIDKIIFLASNYTLKRAEEYKSNIKEIYSSEIVVINPSDIDNIITELINIINNNQEYNFVYNITSGTKIMSLACFIAAIFNNSKVIYIFKKDNGDMDMIELPILRFDIKEFIEKHPKTLNILNKIEEGEYTISSLAKDLNLKPQTVYGHIKKLTELGLIDNKNKRNYKLQVNSTGKLMLKLSKMEGLLDVK